MFLCRIINPHRRISHRRVFTSAVVVFLDSVRPNPFRIGLNRAAVVSTRKVMGPQVVGLPGLAIDHLQTSGTLNQLSPDVVSLVMMFEPVRHSEETPLTGVLNLTAVEVSFPQVRLQLELRRENIQTEGTPPVLALPQQTQAGQGSLPSG